MTPEQTAAERRVINAAKNIERAHQYGIPAQRAHAEYDRARREQAEQREATR